MGFSAQRFKGSKVDAYKPSGHSITHTLQRTILCKEETKIGQRYCKKCLACTKISALPLSNNSTMNSELTRGEWQVMKCSKWESSAVWLSQSGQGLVPMLGLVRIRYKDWRASAASLLAMCIVRDTYHVRTYVRMNVPYASSTMSQHSGAETKTVSSVFVNCLLTYS